MKSKETRRKMGLSKIGNTYGRANRGRVFSAETIEKMKVAKKGKHLSPSTEFRKGQVSPMKGRKRQDIVGGKNPKWKHGLSKTNSYNRIYKMRYRARKYSALGSHTLGEWETLKAQFNHTCPSCGKSEPEIKLSADHIIPLSKGGSDNIENIQPLCQRCNSRKNTSVATYKPI